MILHLCRPPTHPQSRDFAHDRNQNWLQAPPKGALAGYPSLDSQGSVAIEAHHDPAAFARASESGNTARLAYLGGMDHQVPVHLVPSVAEKVVRPEPEVEEPWELSPERIRNPRHRPRRRDIKLSTRRNLMRDFKRLSGPSYSGVNTGSVCLGVSESPDCDSARSRSIFDWSAFSGRKQGEASSSRTTAADRSEVQRGKRAAVVVVDGTLSDVAPLNDSGWTTSSGSSSPNEIGCSSVHPNDSCIDYHDESSIHLDGSTRDASLLNFPTIPLCSALEIRKTPLTAPEIHTVVRQIASALAELHGQDIVHRHVTPDMILVDDPMNVGAALLQESPFAAAITESTRFFDNRAVGPAGFAPPEVGRSCRGCVPYSPASDMWGLGVVILVMAMPKAECGPFGRSGFKPVCPRPNPPLNATMDAMQDWITERLDTYMNCADPATENCEGVPCPIQALAHMLLRADPGQRATAGYLTSRQWVYRTAPQPVGERYVMSESFTPSSSQSIVNVTTPQSLRMRASRSNSMATVDFEDVAEDETGKEKPRMGMPAPKSQRPGHCECFVSAGKVACEMLKSGTSKKHEDSDVGSSMWSSVVGLFYGRT